MFAVNTHLSGLIIVQNTVNFHYLRNSETCTRHAYEVGNGYYGGISS
jgi:hypothetical protein